MFFNKKKKITVSEIANILELDGLCGDIVADKRNCKEAFGLEMLSDHQNRELLIFHMFAYTKAINDTTNGDKIHHTIIDKFHDRIYEKMFKLPSEIGELRCFETLVHQRYAEYYKCFEVKDNDDLTLNIGQTLNFNLFGEKTTDILETMKAGIYAMADLIAKKNVADSIKKDYQIVIDE